MRYNYVYASHINPSKQIMKYVIKNSAIGRSGPELALTRKEHDEIKSARKTLSAGLAIEEIYEALIGNYEDFEKEIINLAIDSMIHKKISYDDYRIYRVKSNRKLINVLTTARLYTDSIQHYISDIIPDKSLGKDVIKASFSNHYDTTIEYKFMEGLRNYVQHRGFPVHRTSERWWAINNRTPNKKGVHSLDVQSENTILEQDKKFKKDVLDKFDEKIDLKHTTRVYIQCLSITHGQIRDMTKTQLNDSRLLIENAIKRFQKAEKISHACM